MVKMLGARAKIAEKGGATATQKSSGSAKLFVLLSRNARGLPRTANYLPIYINS
jgi:hypothetical protein